MKRSLQEILLILAEFYKHPDERLFDAIESGALEDEWNTHLQNLHVHDGNVTLKHSFASFEQMRAIYNRCFVGPNTPFAPPVESIYKQWTEDPTATTPIANETGYLFGDPAVHMKHLYKEYHLKIPEQYSKMPDHLGLQIEFLAFLMDYCTFEQLEQYMDDHFDWLDSFQDELKLVKESDFYVWLTDQLKQTICFIRLKAELFS